MSADDLTPNAPTWVQSVTLEVIAAQRAAGWPDFHPEDFCHRCGQRNPLWFTPDWHEAFPTHAGIVCPTCFAAAAPGGDWRFARWSLPEDGEKAALARLLAAVSGLGDEAERVASCVLNAGWSRWAAPDTEGRGQA